MAINKKSHILLLAAISLCSFIAGSFSGVDRLIISEFTQSAKESTSYSSQKSKYRGTRIHSYFSPDGGAEAAILRELDKDCQSVTVALYFFTRRELAEALVKAKMRGASVEVLLDKSQENRKDSLVDLLLASDIPVYIDTEHRIMHNKFAIIGKSTVITGSQNWTYSAEKKNAENTLVIRNNYHLASKYRDTFQALKGKARLLVRSRKE